MTAVFEKSNSHLVFDGTYEKDKERSELETGYISPYTGDSGSSFWITSEGLDPELEKNKAIVVAIQHATALDSVRMTIDEKTQCKIWSTKLNQDIVKWAKVMSGIVEKDLENN